ncbi:hypothetical protein [Neisseria dentiae]
MPPPLFYLPETALSEGRLKHPIIVIPAQAGIQSFSHKLLK